MNAWYTVYTLSSRELVAQQNLINQGFDCFLPQYSKVRRHARKVDTVLKPLFPRYLFVSMDPEQQRWRSINGTIGVNTLLCNGDQPLAVPDEVINAIRARENDDGSIALSDPGFTPGQTLRVLDGPFADLEGMFERMDDNKRVMLLLNLLGRQVLTRVPRALVTAA